MTELTKTQEQSLQVYDANVLGAADDINANDIQIGRIAVMQALSDLVQAEDSEFKAGQIVNLDTEEVLGGTKEPFEFIILKSFKYWIEKENDDFKARYPATDPNELPWEEGNIKRMYHHAFYVLLPKDLEDGFAMPYEVAFRSTDLQSAKRISKFLLMMRQKKQASWNKVFNMTTELKTKDNYKWYATNVKVGDDTTADQRQIAYEWFNTITQNADKITTTEYVESDTKASIEEQAEY